MFQDIAYFPVFGKPVIMYLGILTIASMLATASVPVLRKSAVNIPFFWHIRLAAVTIALALIHGFLGVMAYF
jgi:hypothetical protein